MTIGVSVMLHYSLGTSAVQSSPSERRLSHILRPRSIQRCRVLQEYDVSGYNVNLASVCPWENELKSDQGQFYYEAKCLCEQPSSSYVISDNIRCRKVFKSIKFQKLTCSNGCRVDFIEKQVAVACVAVFSQ